MDGRTSKSTRNAAFGVAGQIINIIFSLISRTVFLYCFSKEYVGVSSLFSGILSVLSLADLGMETSMTVQLYEPLKNNDVEKIRALLNFYKKTFNIIGLAIAAIGVGLIPFLKYLVDIPKNVPNIYLIYILTLANTVVSYLFIYRKTLIIADQRKYVTDIINFIQIFVQHIVSIPLLIITRSYELYLIIAIVSTLLYNIIVMLYAKKHYNNVIVGKARTLNLAEKNRVVKDMGSISIHRVGDVVNSNAVTLLTGSLISVIAVSQYSNYRLITNYVTVIIDKVFYAISPSVGNLVAEHNPEKSHSILKRMLFISFWLSCVCSSCLVGLLNPFILLWTSDKSYLLSYSVVVVLTLNFYLTNMRKPALIFKEAYGFFAEDRFCPIIEAAVNVGTSLLFVVVFDMGISGIIGGSVLSRLLTSFWVEPYILYKKGLKRTLTPYFSEQLLYFVISCISCTICYCVCNLFGDGWIFLIFRLILCFLISNMVCAVVFHKNSDYLWMVAYGKSMFIKILKGLKKAK